MKSFSLWFRLRKIWGSLWKQANEHGLIVLENPRRGVQNEKFFMWKHTEKPPHPPVSKVVYLWTVHWRITVSKRWWSLSCISPLLISLLTSALCLEISLSGLHWSLYTCLSFLVKCILSYILHMILTSVGQNSVKIKPSGLLVAACLFLSSSDSLLSCCLNGWREGPGRRESAGDGLVGWNPCVSLFKAVEQWFFTYLLIIIFIGVQLL